MTTDAAYLHGVVDTWNAATQRLCDEQPGQGAIRAALLRAEKTAHQGGWDSPPEVFFLGRHPRTGKVRHIQAKTFTAMCRDLPQRPPVTLEGIAWSSEMCRNNDIQASHLRDLPDHARALSLALLGEYPQVSPSEDLFDLGQGYVFSRCWVYDRSVGRARSR